MGMSSECFAATRERGEESVHAPLLAESLVFQSCFLRDIALLPGFNLQPQAPSLFAPLGLLASLQGVRQRAVPAV